MRAEAYIDDSMITAKVKAAFVKDPDVTVLKVSLKTDKGLGQEKIVTLIAWRLETAMTKSHARGLGWDVRPLRLLSSGR